MRRQHERKRTFLAAVVGAAAAALLDPRAGRRRRALVKDRSRRFVHTARRRGERRRRMLTSRSRGYVARARNRTRRGSFVQPDDATLAQKVETELFRPRDVPKGQINVNVQEGVVQLRGEVPHEQMMRELVERARAIVGVREVENLLHLPGVPAPMHQ